MEKKKFYLDTREDKFLKIRVDDLIHEQLKLLSIKNNISINMILNNIIIEYLFKNPLNDNFKECMEKYNNNKNLRLRNSQRKQIRKNRSEFISKYTMLNRLQLDFIKILQTSQNRKDKKNILKNLISSYEKEAEIYPNNIDILTHLEDIKNNIDNSIENTNRIIEMKSLSEEL